MKSKLLLCVAGVLVIGLIFLAASPEKKPDPSEAARLNNLGCAYMNQQFFEKALKYFEDAATADPNLNVAKVNEGIALMGLARVDQAKKILDEAAKNGVESHKNDPHVWYSLGLLDKNSADPQGAVEDFKRVIAIDDSDADTWYFLGTVYSQLKQFPQAIDSFEHALKLNPLHASAQFGLSRALQQSGDTPHAREHLARFQYITQNHLGAAMSLAYGDQGKYSLAEDSPASVFKVPPQIPVKFVDVTKAAGIVTKPRIVEQATMSDDGKINTPPTDEIFGNGLEIGTGACFLDYDGDGLVDIFLPDGGPQGGLGLYHNVGGGKFEDATNKAGFDASLYGVGCTAGDYDNDSFVDLAVSVDGRVRLFHNEKNGSFKDVTNAAGINSAGVGLTFIDYDHDGDLDLYIIRAGMEADREPGAGNGGHPTRTSSNLMFRNNGNGTFTDVTTSVGLRGDWLGFSAIGTDYNNDRAVDVVVSGSYPKIYENPREGEFIAHVSGWLGPLGDKNSLTSGITVLDSAHTGWMDLAFTKTGPVATVLFRNDHGSFRYVPLPETNWARAYGIAALDYDNDGWVDLVAVGETKEGRGEIKLFRNLGPDGWKDVTADVGLDKIQLKEPRAIITGDYDNDGATDLLITQNHGPAVLLKNVGGNKNNWLRLALKGLNDNKSAIGTKVEVFSDGIRQKYEIYGSNGYLGQNSPYLTIGLGPAKQADVVRLLWPTGVLQDEVEIPANQQKDIQEIDRRGSSCPTLFVWDGSRYVLVSDILGAGVVGHWVGPGERNIPRPTEWVKIDPNVIKQKPEGAPSLSSAPFARQEPALSDRPTGGSRTGGEVDVTSVEGQSLHPVSANNASTRMGHPGSTRMGHPVLSFRLMEPMEEVVYLDAVKLVAVDHPANQDVYPNEYFASNPPYPEFKVVTSEKAKPPAGAWDDKGKNLLPDILAHKYVGNFDLLPFKGFTKPHSLTLDLGEPYRGGPLHLLMHGEIEYFTATGMYAASQAGIEAVAPYVEVQDAGGKWVRVLDDMGFPAGLPKTITVDLTGNLPLGAQKIRITTNLQIYWDNILLDRSAQDDNFKLQEIPLTRANLEFHGYPRQIEDQPPGNVKYVYEQVSRTGPYARQAGEYTRYGDVLPLLESFDDKLVVFGSGEEVALEFDPGKLPPLPKGWVRDYFFNANGYEKDMDFYAADGNTVEPLPFRRMGTYPYSGKSFPNDPDHLDYMLKYNTRFMSGNEPRGYAYDYGVK